MMEELPDSLILHILNNRSLDHVDVCSFSRTCSRFSRIASDDILWRNLFRRQFGIINFDRNLTLEPLGCDTWMAEFKRLFDETPMVETENLAQHTDQVLHVSFSHDGKLFATSAKDGFVHIWRNGHPVTVEHSRNMKFFSWKYTQFTQFNESDTLLLVSGVLFGHHSTSGEIAILSVKDGFDLQCRVMSKPYDIFGSWYSDMYFLSGQHQWLSSLVSKSVIWLNMASQESQSEKAAVMNELYKFYNPKASSVRSLMIANCVDQPTDTEEEVGTSRSTDEGLTVKDSTNEGDEERSSHCDCGDQVQGNPVSNLQLEQQQQAELLQINSRGLQGTLQGAFQNWRPLDNATANINYSDAYRNSQHKANTGEASSSVEDDADDTMEAPTRYNCEVKNRFDTKSYYKCNPSSKSSSSSASDDEDKSQREASVEEDHILDNREKLLIFTCSSLTYTPHRIGFKRIKPMEFKGKLDPGPSIKERIQEFKRRRQLEIDGIDEERINWGDYEAVAMRFDKIDHLIDLHGHIIGMTLSPDHRYLYVNSRPWPENYKISNPLEPPPIASEIDIHVIDLKTLTQVGKMNRQHRAYTSNEDCFFIFLDACEQYVASGAEDKHGYVWDRLYGISLVKLPHLDVVNSVAFNPVEHEMLVTVSDDYKIKVWRSRGQCRKLGIDMSTLSKGTALYQYDKNSKRVCSRNPSRSAST